MKTKIIRIGNSKCIRIPKSFIEKYQLGGEITLVPSKSGLLITSSSKSRNGWEEVFKNSVTGQKDSDGPAWRSYPNHYDSDGWSW